jgi:hypothetical protein
MIKSEHELTLLLFYFIQKLRLMLLLLSTLLFASGVLSSKILFLAAFPGKSHWLMFQPVINEV